MSRPATQQLSEAFAAAGTIILALSACWCIFQPIWLPSKLSVAPLAIIAIVVAITDRERLKFIPWSIAPLWIFWIAAACFSLTSTINYHTPKEFRHDTIYPALLFFSSLIILKKTWQLKVILFFLLAGSLILASSGILQYYELTKAQGLGLLEGFQAVRVNGLALTIHLYIFRLFTALPFWVAAIAIAKTKWERNVLLAGLAIVFTGWLLGYGRVEMMVLILLAFLALLMKFLPRRPFNALLTTIVLITVIGVAWVSLTKTELNQSDLKSRQFMWNISANYIKKHPFTGIGFGNHSYKYIKDSLSYSDFPASPYKHFAPPGGPHPHNFLINTWLTTGLQGLLAIIFLATQVYRSAYPPTGPKIKKNIQENLLARAFCLTFIGALMINMSDLMLTDNVMKLYGILGGFGVAAARMARADKKLSILTK